MFEHISVFDFINEIDKITEKLKLDLNIELERAVLLTITTNRGGYRTT